MVAKVAKRVGSRLVQKGEDSHQFAYHDEKEGITICLWDRTFIDALVSACTLYLQYGDGIKPQYSESLRDLKYAAEKYSHALLDEEIRGRHA